MHTGAVEPVDIPVVPGVHTGDSLAPGDTAPVVPGGLVADTVAPVPVVPAEQPEHTVHTVAAPAAVHNPVEGLAEPVPVDIPVEPAEHTGVSGELVVRILAVPVPVKLARVPGPAEHIVDNRHIEARRVRWGA